MKTIVAFALLAVLGTCQANRQARLFFATISSSTSTSTTTSTLTTTSICYSYTTLTGTCSGKRKKRNLPEFEDESLIPSPVQSPEELFGIPDEKSVRPSYRDARFFLLSTSTSTITATATSTSTTYAATLTLTVNCTPTSISVCG